MVAQPKTIPMPGLALADLQAELHWLAQVLTCRLQLFFGQEVAHTAITDLPPPTLTGADAYGQFVCQHQLGFDERLILALATAPHVQPCLLDPLYIKNATYDRPFTEFGGLHLEAHNSYSPTLQTALFLLAGTELTHRPSHLAYFGQGHLFAQQQVLQLPPADGPQLNTPLTLCPGWASHFITGQKAQPTGTATGLPAQPVHSAMAWADLVLPQQTEEQLHDILDWLQHGHTLMHQWGLGKRLKPGYSALFYGPPGTGKTLTATLLGKATSLEVYRIDLSQVVSKYVGETEKNLARVFQHAEARNWVLFFDEADALFGKRTEVSSAHDRYANQEVAYLLQRLDDYAGLAILATNLKTNIDEAFARRFHSTVYFPVPDADLRLQLWQAVLPAQATLHPAVDLTEIAQQYPLAGGSITNVVRYCCLQLLAGKSQTVTPALLQKGIQRELTKEGRTTN